jgi:hypothetical protein
MPTVVTTLKRHSVLADVLPGPMPARLVAQPCLNRRHPRTGRDAGGSGMQVDQFVGEVPV